MNDYYVLLYYHYATIEDLETFRDEHHAFCDSKNLLGRIYVAKEGINGTVSGLKQDVNDYMGSFRWPLSRKPCKYLKMKRLTLLSPC